MYRVLGAFVFGLIFVGSAYAQNKPVLKSGAEIRFTLFADGSVEQARAAADATPVRGRFVGLRADSLEFRSSLTKRDQQGSDRSTRAQPGRKDGR